MRGVRSRPARWDTTSTSSHYRYHLIADYRLPALLLAGVLLSNVVCLMEIMHSLCVCVCVCVCVSVCVCVAGETQQGAADSAEVFEEEPTG